jgi:threonine/homoserine/homoserine lactone efflux protein
MPFENWVAFSLASIVLLAIPGPTVLVVVGHSLAHGRRAGRFLVAAVCLGDTTCGALSLAGLGLLLQDSDLGLRLLQSVGGLCLIYLGSELLLTCKSRRQPSAQSGSKVDQNVFGSTYLVTALNPKGIVFFSAFLPMFVSPEYPAAPQLWVLAATFVALATLSAGIYAELALSTRARLGWVEGLALIRSMAGGLLILIGIFAIFR